MRLLIVVPAYNEAAVIFKTLKKIKHKTKAIKNKSILVIDDGSTDNTYYQAKRSRVKVIRHIINRGLGGAVGTGLAYAKRHNFDILVTIDADGQHDPQDIHTIIKPIIKRQADLVIGSRTISKKGKFPLDRKLLVQASNIFTEFLYGQSTTDSQSGFRAFNKKAINSVEIKTDRMEVSSELFSEIKKLKLQVSEIPIKIIYTKYSRSKGQPNTNALNIIFKSLLRLFR